jgi:RNA polymerase sigma-70 factor (ECF subfamily)
MEVVSQARAAFLEALAREHPDAASAPLHPALEEMWAKARAAWPAVTLTEEAFFSHVASRLPEAGTALDALARVRAADLYLACACAHGDVAAIRAFDTRYLVDLDAVARRFNYVAAGVDDVRQILHERFFLGTEAERPRIHDYNGDGDLRNWTRVVIVRTFINLASRGSREVPTDDDWLFALVEGGEADEVQHLKRAYGEEVKAAFRQAVEELSFRDRAILRYAFVDDLPVHKIGEIYGVHRATVARWIGHARDRFAGHLRGELLSRLRVSESEIDSILRLTMSGVDISLARHLRGGPVHKTA